MSRCFAAAPAAVGDALECLRAAGAAAGLSPDAMKRVELVIEELFTNTATHGTALARSLASQAAAGRCGGPDDTKVSASSTAPGAMVSLSIWLEADVLPDGQGLLVRYEDDGPAFDPLAVPDGTAEAALADAQAGMAEGGLGRVLIRELPAAVRYARKDARNALELVFTR